ncbi:hypothetical protein [Marinobacterium sp. xm-d-564]|uniref:hypothetical protein n=1 Tax=Marinobacterium sp. xm-d-564 TaxID=2497742 RepID=UPI001568C219|nr:hypothetical protein [Marinobacterium sp. xm-d-564]NRP60175.1 hypothetical protein [Marinobacterium sp. xm-d-564]
MTIERAILFADRKGKELTPLNDRYPICLLPIAGKTPLEFWLEQLCDMGVKEVDIVINQFADLIKKAVPNGDHWGLKLNYHLSTGEEPPLTFWSRMHFSSTGKMIAARADVLPAKTDQGVISNLLTLDSDSVEQLNALEWSRSEDRQSDSYSLASLDAYVKAYFALLNGDYYGLVPRGLRADDDKWLATPTFSSSRSDPIEGPLYIGRDVMIDQNATLSQTAVEAGSMVDKGAQLNRAIVFPGTYVGQDVSLTDSIAMGSLLVDLKHQSVIQIADPALISPIIPSSSLVKTNTSERLVASMLMILSAPVALPLALITQKSGVLNREDQLSNRGSRLHPLWFTKLNFTSNIGWVKRWPELLGVIDGDLKLFGSEYESIEDERPITDLPISQGLFTPQSVFKNQSLDEFERQLWGLELANEKLGPFRLFARAIKVSLKNI